MHTRFVAALLVCSAAWCPAELRAQTVDSAFSSFGPGDRVFSTARQGNTLYVGGLFDLVGSSAGGGVPIDRRTGLFLPGFPKITGEVDAVVSDEHGGWFIGGNFSAVDGRPHGSIAHLTSRGLDRDWLSEANGEVRALALANGVLYVGGGFDSIGSSPRLHLAALSASDGTPTAWNPRPDAGVLALLVRGDVVFAGGYFANVGSLARPHAAAIDRNTGQPLVWNPGFNNDVLCLAAVDSTLFAGGQFDAVGDSSRPWVAAVDANSGRVLEWNADLTRTPDTSYDGGPRIESLLVRNGLLYLAGFYNAVGGIPREGLAAVSASSATLDSWNPRTSLPGLYGAYFRSMAASGDTLFVSGFADEIGSATGMVARKAFLHALSFSSGDRYDWDPRLYSNVRALAIQGEVVFAGGPRGAVGEWVRRKNLAAFDATTGALLPWNPAPNNTVLSIVTRDNTVYVGGLFTAVGGQLRSEVAALDGVTGQATDWNPGGGAGAPNVVYSLALWKNSLLIGGWFDQLGGVTRHNLAAVDTRTGSVTGWDPSTDDIVYCVLPADSVIYAGGWFGAVGGESHRTLVALDPDTGRPRSWAPSTDGYVNSIATARGRMFIGGRFRHVNDEERVCLAAFDSSGTLSDWRGDTDPIADIRTLLARDTVLYAGGSFSMVAGEPHHSLAAIDSRTGAPLEGCPMANDWVYSLTLHDDTIYAGGIFTNMGAWPQSGLAVLLLWQDVPVPPPSPAGAFLAQCFPNPARASATIRFSLPSAANVTLSVFDLQGRPVAKPLSETLEPAGMRSVDLSTSAWKPGLYWYRLQGGAIDLVRKMVVVK